MLMKFPFAAPAIVLTHVEKRRFVLPVLGPPGGSSRRAGAAKMWKRQRKTSQQTHRQTAVPRWSVTRWSHVRFPLKNSNQFGGSGSVPLDHEEK